MSYLKTRYLLGSGKTVSIFGQFQVFFRGNYFFSSPVPPVGLCTESPPGSVNQKRFFLGVGGMGIGVQ